MNYEIVSEKSISLIRNIRPPPLSSLLPIVILTLSYKVRTFIIYKYLYIIIEYKYNIPMSYNVSHFAHYQIWENWRRCNELCQWMINKAVVRKHVRCPRTDGEFCTMLCSAPNPFRREEGGSREAPFSHPSWNCITRYTCPVWKLQVGLWGLHLFFIYKYRLGPTLSGVKCQDHPNPTAGPAEARGPSALLFLHLHHWWVWWKRQTELTLVLLDFNYTLKEKKWSFQGCGEVQEIQKGIPPGNFVIILPKLK